MFDDLFNNNVLNASLAALLIAQIIKVPYNLILRRQLNWGLLLSAGGMPSSHSAFVTSLTMSVGLLNGFNSVAFAISAVLALVVMYDAAGVRRAASRQARILNVILEQLFAGQSISEERLKEFIGHTPVEVIVGAILGVAVALWLV